MDDGAHSFVHEWHNQTTLHPLAVAALLVLAALAYTLPRRRALLPLLVLACFIPPAQRLVVATLDFPLIRLMLLAMLARVVARREAADVRPVALDYLLCTFAAAHVVTAVVRMGPDVLVNKLGLSFDVLLTYFLCRVLVRNLEDLATFARGACVVAMPVAVAFTIERLTARNAFSVFGGINPITMVREGRLRCQGAYPHPIVAGVFWASLLPMMAALWWASPRSAAGPRHRIYAVVGVTCGLVVIVATNSATPLTGVMAAGVGLALFRWRRWLQVGRWGLLAMIVGLHMVMQAPVWHLVSRIDLVGGSGYHRYQLIDGAIRNVHEWWLIGSTVGTDHWGHFTFDITNTYIVQGLHGGVTLLALFVAIITLAYQRVGRAIRQLDGRSKKTRQERDRLIWIWALGVTVFVHTMSFIALSYFGQVTTMWYFLLGTIGSLCALNPRATKAAAPATAGLAATVCDRAATDHAAPAARPEYAAA